jgi:hypothetical protein
VRDSTVQRGETQMRQPKCHGWKSVDCSTPAYQGSATNSLNATDGNPWIVQIQPALLSRYLFMTNVVNRFSEANSHI